MKRFRITRATMKTMTTLMMAGTLALSLPAAAQPDQQKRAAVRQQLADFAMQQLTQQLALDAATATSFRAVSDRYQEQIAAVHREVGMAVKELKQQLAAAQPNGARLTQLSDLVVSNRAKVQQLESQRTVEYRRVLSPAQFAKLILSWPQINRQIHVQMWKAMHNGQPPTDGEELQ